MKAYVCLNSQPDLEVVAEAADGREAVRLANELAPDVVVMDISMPGMNRLEATKKLKECSSASRVLTLTCHADDGFLKQLLSAGAFGYALKLSSARPPQASIAIGCRTLNEAQSRRHWFED